MIAEGWERALSATETVHTTDATKKCASADASLLVCDLRARYQVETRQNLSSWRAGRKGRLGLRGWD